MARMKGDKASLEKRLIKLKGVRQNRKETLLENA